jgi:hypothetical protein
MQLQHVRQSVPLDSDTDVNSILRDLDPVAMDDVSVSSRLASRYEAANMDPASAYDAETFSAEFGLGGNLG